MRQKRKITNKLLIFGIVFMLFSCSEDLYDEQINQRNFKTEVVPIRKLEKDFNFKQNFQKVTGKSFQSKLEKNNTAIMRGEFSTDYVIVDTLAHVASGEGLISYNFKIEYPSKPATDTIHNLVIHENNNTQISDYFITKNIVSAEKLTPVTITTSDETSRGIMDCFEWIADPRFFRHITLYIDWECIEASGGSGSGGTNTGGVGGNNGDTGGDGSGTSWNGGGSSTGGVLVSPIDGAGSNTNSANTDPCATLTGAKNDTKVQTAIDSLRTKTTGKKEFAYEIERRKTDLTETGSTYNTILKTGNNFGVIVGYGAYVQGQAHNHPINGLHIPSWDDIYWTQGCEEENTNFNNGSAYNIIVAPDPTNPGETILWAITIDNIATLQQATNAVFDLPEIVAILDEELKRDEIKKIFGDKFAAIQFDTDAQEKMFLQTYANYGITLSKFNETTDKWEKLKLDPTNPNIVTKVPCN